MSALTEKLASESTKVVSALAFEHLSKVGPDLHIPSVACGMKICRDAIQETMRSTMKVMGPHADARDAFRILIEELDSFPIVGEIK